MAERLITTDILEAEANSIKNKLHSTSAIEYTNEGFAAAITAINAIPTNIPFITYPNSHTVKLYNFRNLYANECPRLEKIDLTNSPQIILENDTFSMYDSMNEIILPESLNDIPTRCFADCMALESINLGRILTFGESAFESCSLLSIDGFSNYLERIEPRAFNGIRGGDNLEIGQNLQFIGYGAFSYLTSGFNKIWIRESDSIIEANAFNAIHGLTIYCEADSKPDSWDDDWAYNEGEENTIIWGQKTQPW